MLNPVEKQAKAIHAELRSGADREDVLAKYQILLDAHPDQRRVILSWRADSWGWINEIGRAIEDLEEAVKDEHGRGVAGDLCHLSRRYLQLHQFRTAEPVLSRLIRLELDEGSTYFIEYARLMRAYCLARINRGKDALLELEGLAANVEEAWIDNLPRVTPDFIRELVAKSSR